MPATHKAGDLFICWRQDVLDASKIDCRTARRPLDETHLEVEPSGTSQADRVSEARRTGQEMRVRRSHRRHSVVQHMESHFLSSRFKPPDSDHHDIAHFIPTAIGHDDDEDDALLGSFQPIEDGSSGYSKQKTNQWTNENNKQCACDTM